VSLRQAIASVAALVAVAGAVLLAVLALDALRWRGQLEDADLRYAAREGNAGMWEPDTRFPVSLTRDVLGVDDDIAYRRAVQAFRVVNVARAPRDLADVGRRGQVELQLGRLTGSGLDAESRSLAANLRGVLAFEEARNDSGGQTVVFLRRALSEFRRAITLDPTNEPAKYNLELTLRLMQLSSQDSQSGGGGERADTPASGAGAATSGSGY
jgi:hypothetical protein